MTRYFKVKKRCFMVILIISIFCMTGCSSTNSNIKNYLKSGEIIDSRAKDIMPDIDELPKYEDIEYRYTHKSILFFSSDSVALVVSYDDSTFDSEKEKIDKQYTFLDKEINADYDITKYNIPEFEFEVNSYAFRVIDKDGTPNTEYPKSFGMIGISEKKKSIAYLYFYDSDLDYIGDGNEKNPMSNFVKDYFHYKF